MSAHHKRRLFLAAALPVTVATALFGLPALQADAAPSTTLVINEVYGGGGNSGATFKNDFIEVRNISASSVDVSGYSVQYNSATGIGSFQVTNLSGKIPAGATYLVQESAGAGGTADLPTPDATGSINLSGTTGRVALVSTQSALSCPAGTCAGAAGVVDFVGWGAGTVNDYEGAKGPASSNTTSIARNGAGSDTDDNSTDFVAGAPSPTPCGSACVVPPSAATIAQIQGARHLSPYNGQSVTGVTGVITARDARGLYVQDPRGSGAPGYVAGASSGVYVFTSSAPGAALQPGASVSIDGKVSEFRPGASGLTTTEIVTPSVTVVDPSAGLVAPTEIGPNGLHVPTTVIDNDAPPGGQINVETSGQYQPNEDGIDFWESLEGMLVDLPNARVVGPTNTTYGETPIVPQGSGTQTNRGGIVLLPNDPNPERIVLDSSSTAVPSANVGDSYSDAVGNVGYDFNNFHLMASTPPLLQPGGITREATQQAANDELSVATFNVENLDPTDPQSKFDDLAHIIVANLKAPDLVALEEVQDNNGATDNGTTAADQTLSQLIAAIAAQGGPSYSYRQIDPVNDAEGGEPGGNIRVAFLIQDGTPLSFVEHDPGTSTQDTDVVTASDGSPQLTHSPGRVDPGNAAWASTRVPLAGQFTFGGQQVFVVANHWSSKGGDQPLYGANQPPIQGSEAKRVTQAQTVNHFVHEILDVDPQANVVVLGDLNDFEYSDSVTTLTENGSALLDLPSTLPDQERYTYVYEGNSQVLDHILLSDGLANQGYDYDIVHVNAEFNDQASDHDPQVVDLHLGLAAAGLTATSAPTPVVYGSSSTIAGTLTNEDGSPISGATVALTSRHGPDPYASTGATTTTGPTGSYSFTVSPAATTDYRVEFAGDSTHAAASSPGVTVEVATRVSLAVGSTVLKKGDSTMFAGVVAPNHEGQTVLVQALQGTTWVTIDSVTLDQDSFYSYILVTSKKATKGTTSYRIAKPADGDHVLGVSPTVAITVT